MDQPQHSDDKTKNQGSGSPEEDSISPSSKGTKDAEEQPKNTQENTRKTKDQDNPPKPPGWWRRKWHFVIEPKNSNALVAIFSALLFVATVVYAVFAGLQWNVILKTMRIDQRPWMTPKAASLLQFKVGQRIGWDIYMQNIGKTAAFNVHGDFRMKIVREDQEFAFDYPEPHPTIDTPVIWQNESTPAQTLLILTSPAQPTVLTPALSQQFLDREMEIVSYGQISYEDMWGLKHLTTFCKSERSPDPSGIIYMSSIGKKCTVYTSVDGNY